MEQSVHRPEPMQSAHHGTQMIGDAAREHQDCANGTRQKVVQTYKVASAASHIVLGKALRRSIADAYASFVGQVDQIPGDDYGLALYALERAYPPDIRPTGAHDLNLTTSPFVTSKAKHAAIFNTARHILNTLDGYEHKVAAVCPQQLRQLVNRQPIKKEHPYTHVCAKKKPAKGADGLKPGQHHIGIPATHCRAQHTEAAGACAKMPVPKAPQHPQQHQQHRHPSPPLQQPYRAPGTAQPQNVACAVTSAAALKVSTLRHQGVSGAPAPAAGGQCRPASAPCQLPQVRHIAAHKRVAEYYHRDISPSKPAAHAVPHPSRHTGTGQPGGRPSTSDNYPYRLPQHGPAVPRVHPLVAPHQSVCEVLGFTMTDAQLLKLIKKHKESLETAEQRKAEEAAAKAAMPCENNRSRRLAPPDEWVHISRQCHVPIMAVPNLLKQCDAAPPPPAPAAQSEPVRAAQCEPVRAATAPNPTPTGHQPGHSVTTIQAVAVKQ